MLRVASLRFARSNARCRRDIRRAPSINIARPAFSAFSSQIRAGDDSEPVRAFAGRTGRRAGGGTGNGYGSTSLVWMSLREGECSTRERRESLFKCCVSRELLSAESMKSGLAGRTAEVEKGRRPAAATGVRSAEGGMASDIV